MAGDQAQTGTQSHFGKCLIQSRMIPKTRGPSNARRLPEFPQTGRHRYSIIACKEGHRMPTSSPDNRPRLKDILRASSTDFQRTWDTTEPSNGFDPLPPGVYRCLIADGKLFTSKNNTPGYKLTFEVIDKPYTGRKAWFDAWLSSKALAMAKGELAKLGILSYKQLDDPLPPGLIADVTVVQRTDDNGMTSSRVRTFKVVPADVAPDDFRPSENLEVDQGEGDAGHSDAGRVDAHGFNFVTSRYESATPLLDAKPNGRSKT
jgi:hypothetical protein